MFFHYSHIHIAALGNLNDSEDINTAWENTKENVKILG